MKFPNFKAEISITSILSSKINLGALMDEFYNWKIRKCNDWLCKITKPLFTFGEISLKREFWINLHMEFL
ncbi:unnamed protein product [Blepharisma stoltei]|uniref:Uncharacterized protein n=1 Tax=Blepharisma stoltei TaxID=1481888 RepID=A0AAU9J771_9CILI|nr:unnamed protein product [Blepharisma stoltei]